MDDTICVFRPYLCSPTVSKTGRNLMLCCLKRSSGSQTILWSEGRESCFLLLSQYPSSSFTTLQHQCLSVLDNFIHYSPANIDIEASNESDTQVAPCQKSRHGKCHMIDHMSEDSGTTGIIPARCPLATPILETLRS
jgi:hypothetical protein